MRIRLLGENLIAFRDTSGEVGIVANACPHRGASLFFGRNEEERAALRLPRLEVRRRPAPASTCPPSPPRATSRTRCASRLPLRRAQRHRLGLHGAARDAAAAARPAAQPRRRTARSCSSALQECNWLQALEGDIDTVHAGFLHYGHVKTEKILPGQRRRTTSLSSAGRLSCAQEHEIGTTYGAYRTAEEDTEYWRTGHFLLPFYTMNAPRRPGPEEQRQRLGAAGRREHDGLGRPAAAAADRRPRHRRHQGGANVRAGPARNARPLRPAKRNGARRASSSTTVDWLGRFRPIANKDNDYLIDRDLQGGHGYLPGLPRAQDPMAQETMGTIYDRTQEHLGTSDAMIIRTRRKLLDCVRGRSRRAARTARA